MARPLLAVALSVLVTWPLARAPHDRLLGHPDGDVWNHAWGTWWWSSTLRAGQLPWRTELLRAPDGGLLWFIDPLLAAIGVLLHPWLWTARSYNISVLFFFALTALGAARFARILGASPVGEGMAAVVACASGTMLGAAHNGITEALHLGLVAWALALGEQANRDGRDRSWSAAGAAVGLLTGLSPYLGLSTGLALAARSAGALRRSPRGPLLSLGLALVLAAPGLGLLRASLVSPDALLRRPPTMNEALALVQAVDPREFLRPFGGPARPEPGFVHAGHLGWVALALALWGGRRQRAWWLALVLGLVLALGPWLAVGGAWVEVAGHRLPLPARLLQLVAPELAITHARRFASASVIILAGLAGLGATRLARARPWTGPALVVGALIEGLWVSGVPWPLPTSDARVPTAYAAVSAEPQPGGLVLDLPTDAGATMATSRYLYFQTGHGHPIPYAPDARASTASLMDEPSFQVLAAMCRRRPDEQLELGLDRPPTELRPERLRAAGVRWIYLHRPIDPATTPALEALLVSVLGSGELSADTRWWDLAPPASSRP